MSNPKKRRRWQSKPATLKKYSIDLSDGFRIVAEYTWLRGKITKFALILIRKKDSEDGYHMICRYGTAHGFAHLDQLDYKGAVIEKVAVTGVKSYKTAYTHAKDDLQKNTGAIGRRTLKHRVKSGPKTKTIRAAASGSGKKGNLHVYSVESDPMAKLLVADGFQEMTEAEYEKVRPYLTPKKDK